MKHLIGIGVLIAMLLVCDPGCKQAWRWTSTSMIPIGRSLSRFVFGGVIVREIRSAATRRSAT